MHGLGEGDALVFTTVPLFVVFLCIPLGFLLDVESIDEFPGAVDYIEVILPIVAFVVVAWHIGFLSGDSIPGFGAGVNE